MRAHNFTRKERNEIGIRAEWTCELCGLDALPGHADHILPMIEGGASDITNGRWLCIPCHKIKTAKDIKGLRKSERVRDRHRGTLVSGRPFKSWRRFNGDIVWKS